MEYLIVRGRLKLIADDTRPRLAVLVRAMNRLLGVEGARLAADQVVFRYEGAVGSSREIAEMLREITCCILGGAAVVVRRVRWEAALRLRRPAKTAVRAPR